MDRGPAVNILAAVQARPRMTKSTVVDNETGKSVDSDIRTSTGMFFARGENEVIRRIEKRIAVASNLPEVWSHPEAEVARQAC